MSMNLDRADEMQAHFRHNTHTIIEADDNACIMLRCDRLALHDRSMLDLIYSDEFKGLAKWRLRHIRERGELKSQRLPLLRFDGSVFWAEVQTRRIDAHTFESTVTYLDEY